MSEQPDESLDKSYLHQFLDQSTDEQVMLFVAEMGRTLRDLLAAQAFVAGYFAALLWMDWLCG